MVFHGGSRQASNVQHLDPLLEPYQLRHLTVRNRVVSTSHESASTEDGMLKDHDRLYHLEKARGGVGLTMVGGSAVVSPDSPPAFGNIPLYKDEVVPWLRRLADDVHGAGAAVELVTPERMVGIGVGSADSPACLAAFVEHGTVPNDEVHHACVPFSTNLGQVDHRAPLAGTAQDVNANPAGEFALFRIGDAVASRNIHAAVCDALRLCITV